MKKHKNNSNNKLPFYKEKTGHQGHVLCIIKIKIKRQSSTHRMLANNVRLTDSSGTVIWLWNLWIWEKSIYLIFLKHILPVKHQTPLFMS